LGQLAVSYSADLQGETVTIICVKKEYINDIKKAEAIEDIQDEAHLKDHTQWIDTRGAWVVVELFDLLAGPPFLHENFLLLRGQGSPGTAEWGAQLPGVVLIKESVHLGIMLVFDTPPIVSPSE